MEPGKDFQLFSHWSSLLWSTPWQYRKHKHFLIMSAKMRYCIVQEWMVCYLNFLYFTDICSLYSLWGRKSFHLATEKLCTLCSQTTDRKAWSLKSEMKFHFCWGVKKSIFNWFEWTLPPHATHCLASCLSRLIPIGLPKLSLTKTSFNHPSVKESPLRLPPL
jgi:hypothetical protein